MWDRVESSHYKRCDNPLLIEEENQFTGAIIGYIQVPYVTVADDVALLIYLHLEIHSCLAAVIPIQEEIDMVYTILIAVFLPIKVPEATCSLDEDKVQQETQTKHLGIL